MKKSSKLVPGETMGLREIARHIGWDNHKLEKFVKDHWGYDRFKDIQRHHYLEIYDAISECRAPTEEERNERTRIMDIQMNESDKLRKNYRNIWCILRSIDRHEVKFSDPMIVDEEFTDFQWEAFRNSPHEYFIRCDYVELRDAIWALYCRGEACCVT